FPSLHALRISQQPQSGLLRPQSGLSLRQKFMKREIIQTVFASLLLSASNLRAESGAKTSHHSCCSSNEVVTATPCTDKSIYQVETIWTNDAGRSVKLGILKGRPQIVTMFFDNCRYACPLL